MSDPNLPPPRGLVWRALSERRGDLVIEVFGVPGAWLAMAWRHGRPCRRPLGIAPTAREALSRAAGARVAPAHPADDEGPLDSLGAPGVLQLLAAQAPAMNGAGQRLVGSLALAFGLAPPDFARLAWRDVEGWFNRSPLPPPTSRADAIAQALAGLPLGRHAAMALAAAAAHAAGVDLALAKPISPCAQTPEVAAAEPGTPSSRAVIVARMVTAMLSGPAIEPEAWLTVPEVAALLRLTERDVDQLIEGGYLTAVTLPAFCAEPRRRVRPRDLETLWRKLESTIPCRDASRRSSPRTPNLSCERTAITGFPVVRSHCEANASLVHRRHGAPRS